MKNLYTQNDLPDQIEKDKMWSSIKRSTLVSHPQSQNSIVHWKSFWIGQAAAILLIFAGIGVYNTVQSLQNENNQPPTEQLYSNLNAAVLELDKATPVILEQAELEQKDSIESTLSAIREIDRLIEELKFEMQINGITPSAQQSLKRLYATKLDFYKNLLLTNNDRS